MVVVDALHDDSAAAIADYLFGGGADLQLFLDHVAVEVKASGGDGDEGEEELEWLSNKDAFPTVETMGPSAPRPRTKGARRPRWEVASSTPRAPVVARAPPAGWRCRHCGTNRTPQRREGPDGPSTLCNACGVRYRSGRLVPEYRPARSPTFSPELHSNQHRLVVEMRRRREAAAQASVAAAGNSEEKGGEKLECLSKKGEFLAEQVMAVAAAGPRTEGMRRPRKAVEWPAIAWSPPPPPRAPAVAGRRPSLEGGAGVAVEQGRAPDGGDDGVGGCAAADRGRAAVSAHGGLNPAASLAAATAAGRPCQQSGTEKAPQWLVGYRSSCMVPELRFDWHNRVKLHCRAVRVANFCPATAGDGEEGKEELSWPWPSNNDAFPAVKAMPTPAARPQTKGVRRRRRVVEVSPPRTPPPSRRRSRRAGAVAVEQGRAGDGVAAAVEGRVAVPADGVARWQPRPGLRRRLGGSAGTAGRRRRRSGARVPRGAGPCATRVACGTRPAAWCRSTGRRAAPPSPRVCTPTATTRSFGCAAAGRSRRRPPVPPPLRATSEGFCLTISLIWRFN
ncbi:hypothetical protein PVAP13_9NG267700 [Panicum virgatum]|uniref:GATA-type domain-containing protein n=1 Tax=Panicum virgatum TaxID=38727 RepID=A0A8T0MRM5_PANVG|nr:hypothetical protein PVAP13_9NG267700 [Panicum virgatum]